MAEFSGLVMTNYPAWKKRQVQAKGRSLLALFITLTLILALFNGLIKSFSLGKYFGKSRWDSKSSFVTALSTTPISLVIVQKDPKRIIFLTLDEETYLTTGDPNEPIVKVSSIVDKDKGAQLSKILTFAFRANIENFVTFNKEQKIDKEKAKKWFKDYASITTPFSILTGNLNREVKNTNITRIDLLKLWWQVKGFSINNLDLVDLRQFREEMLSWNNQKVLGVDDVVLKQLIAKYLENLKVREENFKIKISNSSEIAGAGRLAADFVSSVGGNVVEINTSPGTLDKTFLETKDKSSYTARYLANIFNCGINGAPGKGEGADITLVIGQDFILKYFE